MVEIIMTRHIAREDDEMLEIIKQWFGDVITNHGYFCFHYFGYDWRVRKTPIDVLYVDGGRSTEMGYRAEAYIPGAGEDHEIAREEISLYDLLEGIEGTGRF